MKFQKQTPTPALRSLLQENPEFQGSEVSLSSETLIQNQTQAGDMVQLVKCLPSMQEALGAIPCMNQAWWHREVQGLL